MDTVGSDEGDCRWRFDGFGMDGPSNDSRDGIVSREESSDAADDELAFDVAFLSSS